MAADTRQGLRLVLVAWAAFCAGPLLAYLGVVPAFVGFLVFALGGLLGLVALVTGVVALVRGHAAIPSVLAALALTIAFVALAFPGRHYPRINDITTDPANPPQFVFALTLPANQGRDMAYPGKAFAEQQGPAYPDLGPLVIGGLSPDDAFRRVEATARKMPTWEVTRVDPASHRLEAVATSGIFRFQDDVVVEVRARDGGSVIQMRSKSRVGKGDIGANAKRIKDFFGELRWTGPAPGS
jgi:uncharacterized protein (DUF1499 family)